MGCLADERRAERILPFRSADHRRLIRRSGAGVIALAESGESSRSSEGLRS